MASTFVNRANEKLGTSAHTLASLCANRRAKGITLAEINAVTGLHPFLKILPNLAYSEYHSGEPDVPSEDLLKLSYGDETFDYVLTSDVLEHVPNFDQALREIRRVLKVGGQHIFTIPILWDRGTRCRAVLTNDEVVYQLPPSYHGDPAALQGDYLVFAEFGNDVIDRIAEAGFEVDVSRDPQNDLVTSLVATRSGR